MSQLLVDDIVDKDGGNSVGFSKGINVGASSTVTGNLNVTGVLTYEDVTNVDSVGLITARSGIKFGAAGVGGTIRANGDTTLAGVVTATSFSGDVTGDVTGSVTATSSPAITIRDGATEKGYIGFNGNDPFIGRKDGVGVAFQDNKVRPVDGDDGSGSNNTVDLGEPTYKFKDLYLAGNANIAGAGSTFGGNVTLSKAAGPTLELVTNANTANSSLHLSEGTAGSTTNGGAVIYSGANNKLSICCGTDLTTERIGLARDTGEVNIGSGVTISSAGVSTFSGDVNVGSAVTVYASAGIVSATSFSGDGSNLSGISAGAWTPIVSGLVDSGGEYEIIGTTSTLATSSYQMYRLTFYTEQTPSAGESGLQLQIYNGAWREDTNYGYGWISNGGSVDSQTSAKGILLGKMGRRFEGVVQFSNPSQTTRPKWFSARLASMNSDTAWSEPLNFQVSGQYNGSTKNDAVTGIRLRSIDSAPAGGEGAGENFSGGYYLLEGCAIS